MFFRVRPQLLITLFSGLLSYSGQVIITCLDRRGVEELAEGELKSLLKDELVPRGTGEVSVCETESKV